MENEAFYKMQARAARKSADQTTDSGHKQAWLEMAQGYDSLADFVRSQARPNLVRGS